MEAVVFWAYLTIFSWGRELSLYEDRALCETMRESVQRMMLSSPVRVSDGCLPFLLKPVEGA